MKKLAIVGSHPATRSLAPYNNPEWEIWVFNEAPQHDWCLSWDVAFQLHKPEVYTSLKNVNRADHWDWLQRNHGADKIIWMQDEDALVPNSRRYPLEEIRHDVDGHLLTSTVVQAIALALWQGRESIDVWGVDLTSNTEYAYQMPGFLYWSGIARARLGDNFRLHSGQGVFEARVYGYEGETQIEREYFAARAEMWTTEHRRTENALARLKDKLLTCTMENKFLDFPGLVVEAQSMAQDHGIAAGALQESSACANREDPISRQQFERRGAKAQEDGDKTRQLMDKESGKVEYVFNAWMNSGSVDAVKQLRLFTNNLLKLAYDVGGLQGVMRENVLYMQEYDKRLTAAGGERTRRAVLGEANAN